MKALPGNAKVGAVIQYLIDNSPQVKIIDQPDCKIQRDIKFRVDCKLPSSLPQGFYCRTVANFLGEWYVRDCFKTMRSHAARYGRGLPVDTQHHKSFGMRLTGTGLEFRFHVELLDRIAAEKHKAAGKASAGQEMAIGTKGTRRRANAGPSTGAVTRGAYDAFREWLEAIPFQTPLQMFRRLEEFGYVGQDDARRAICLMAHRHLNRLRRIHLQNTARNALPPKQNLLLLGPTGCGKTFLVELLFQRILQLPVVIEDMTRFTETGYKGDDIENMHFRLVEAAGWDHCKASTGIICMDEFDKLASYAMDSSVPAGHSNRDVSGYGVQRGLLAQMQAPDEAPCKDAKEEALPVSRNDIAFVGCGAFSGFAALVRKAKAGPAIGFGGQQVAAKSSITDTIPDADPDLATHFARYGMLPELIGRFGRIVPLQAIGYPEMRAILERQVLDCYRTELSMAGFGLEVDEAAMEHMIGECLEMKTGVRSVASILNSRLEGACFDAYSMPAGVGGTVKLSWDGKRVFSLLSSKDDPVVKRPRGAPASRQVNARKRAKTNARPTHNPVSS